MGAGSRVARLRAEAVPVNAMDKPNDPARSQRRAAKSQGQGLKPHSHRRK
jgi:hypothetical protein